MTVSNLVRVTIYTCAFRCSDCCMQGIFRICEAGLEDRFICRHCWRPCDPWDRPLD